MLVGGAPLSPVVQERMSVLFCCPMIEGYGMTETVGATFITLPNDQTKGSVGGVLPSFEFRLTSVAEMDYLATDNPPRGELCVRGPGTTPGYFGDPVQSKAAIDENGWLHTGDVCVLLPNGSVKIIDRAKNMFKLAQGEYVSPEKIEQVYQQGLLISQVFCFGYSTKPQLVGIIVPDVELSIKWAARNGKEGIKMKDLCEVKEFQNAILQEGDSVASKAQLKGFEKLKAVKLWPFAFSVENDLLTPTMKLKRHQARKYFQSEIDILYEALGG